MGHINRNLRCGQGLDFCSQRDVQCQSQMQSGLVRNRDLVSRHSSLGSPSPRRVAITSCLLQMASAKAAVAYGSTILVPNATQVKVTTTNVDAHEDGIDWAEMGFLIGVVTLLLCCLGAIIAAAAAGHR